jgi:flagellar motility protein MotE (MotC chaperone)
MNLLRERGVLKPLLILFFIFLALKAWVLISLVGEEEGGRGSCLAEPVVSAGTDLPQQSPGVQEEACDLRVGGLIKKIQEEEAQLAEKATRLEEKEQRLQVYGLEVQENINELKKLRLEIQKIHESIEQHENEKQQRLVKIYDAMEPESAAQALEAMDDALDSWLLLRMNVRKAGQILGALSPEKASRITTRLRGEDPLSAKRIEEAMRSTTTGTAPGRSEKSAPDTKPEEAAKAGPEDLSKGKLLQIATFSEPQRADRVVQALKDKGYPSFQKEWTQGEPGKPYYKVFVGPFPDKKEASETKARLEQKEGYQGIMIRTGAAAGV